jgi:tetratricopeptide (TPR) repeat protein
MELLEGQTLKERIEKTKLENRNAKLGSKANFASPTGASVTVDEVLDLAIQIAAGLEAAHGKGIIHRDIKPANIFLTTQGQAKILDFGVAKLTRGTGIQPVALSEPEQGARATAGPTRTTDDTLTQPGSPIGTAAYMSPEQVRGEVLDTRTDIFSFGAVLYEIATGRQAFPGGTSSEVQQAILTQQPASPKSLSPDLPPKLEEIIDKALEKDRALRYQRAADMRAELQSLKRDMESERVAAGLSRHIEGGGIKPPLRRRQASALAGAALILIAAAMGGTLYFRSRQAMTRLTEKDTIVLSDFDNKTGDNVFDDTLKQGLSVQLEQSPFLDLLSEDKVNATLKLMGRQAGDRLTAEVAREVCERTGSKAMLTGSITGLGSQYVIGLNAVTCNTGDVLAEAQEQAAGKELVLKALDAAAVNLRGKLGESLSSVQKYAAPLEEATTPSLEALKAYSLGIKTIHAEGAAPALPYFQQAVDLDANFARAYVWISMIHYYRDQVGRGAEYARKAYDLREKVSQRELFEIEGNYYVTATGELEKAAQTYDLWKRTYPRDAGPHIFRAYLYSVMGNWEKALGEWREALRLEPNTAANYGNIGFVYMALNRLGEAEAAYKQAEERKLESEVLLDYRYELAFLMGNAEQMAKLVSAAMGRPGFEDRVLAVQANTEGWYGKLKNAHELTRRAMESAQHNEAKERAAAYQAAAALREVEAGNREQGRAEAHAALKLAPNRDVRAMAALALARAGDTAEAEKLAAELDKTFPLDTRVQRYWLPAIRAGVALEHKDQVWAIELLKVATTIELGDNGSLCPAYLRGEAYLLLHDGDRAAAEFQKFIDHRGQVVNFPWGALARLGLGRAYALQGNTAKARAGYQDFLTLWKDADPDIPILKEAKAEYAKLQ